MAIVPANQARQNENGRHGAWDARKNEQRTDEALREFATEEETMNIPLSGFGFLIGYIVLVGTASFLEKFSMKQLNPYQVNFLMAIGMAVTAVPALYQTR